MDFLFGQKAGVSSLPDQIAQINVSLAQIGLYLQQIAGAEAPSGNEDDESYLIALSSVAAECPITGRIEALIMGSSANATVGFQVDNAVLWTIGMGVAPVEMPMGSRGQSVRRGAKLSLTATAGTPLGYCIVRSVESEEVTGVGKGQAGLIKSRAGSAR